MSQDKHVDEQRQHQRYPLMLAAEIAAPGGASQCVIFDISEGGAKVRLNPGQEHPLIEKDHAVTLDVPLFADFQGTVAWTDDEYLGIRFTEPDTADVKRVVEISGRNAA